MSPVRIRSLAPIFSVIQNGIRVEAACTPLVDI
jgi:hypothetical protein